MAAINPFDLLRDDDNEDLSQLLAAQQQKIASIKPAASAVAAVTQVPAKLPSKPLPPSQDGKRRKLLMLMILLRLRSRRRMRCHHLRWSSPEVNKAGTVNEEEKEEDKEMTLEEYEKVKEEKRKALLAMQSEERKVECNVYFSMFDFITSLMVVDAMSICRILVKDIGKKQENIDREEKSKKPMSITEFFKLTNGGGRYYAPGGRRRGRLRGGRGQQFGGNFDDGSSSPTAAPSIEDPGQFSTLSGKSEQSIVLSSSAKFWVEGLHEDTVNSHRYCVIYR